MRDPIKAELRRHRQDHARKFNFDLAAICEGLREQSRNLQGIRLPPNRIGRKDENSLGDNP